MTAKYLLPCSCGRKIPIEPRQAGQEVRCACGASVETPTMRRIRDLERAEPERAAEPKSAPWGVRQRIVLLGIVVTLGALVPGVYLLWSRRSPPSREVNSEAIRQASQQLAPIQAWRQWQHFRANGLDRRPLQEDEDYGEANLRWWSNMAVVALVETLGVAMIVVPLLWKRRKTIGSHSRSS